MKKIIAFAGSNSSTSINHHLVLGVAKMNREQIEILRLTDYPLPMYGEDLEKESGYPAVLSDLLTKIRRADGLIISVNEHNGSVSAFFKNVLDWLSRIEYKFLADKKILLMSASPGGRGALSAYQYTESILPRYGGEIVYGFNFPGFKDNFSIEDQEITNDELRDKASEGLATLAKSME